MYNNTVCPTCGKCPTCGSIKPVIVPYGYWPYDPWITYPYVTNDSGPNTKFS